MAKYALIGGKVNSSIIKNKIERYLVDLTKKDKPVVLYCPYAVNDYTKSINKFHELMKEINVDIIDLNNDNMLSFDSLLTKSDILYIGGGSCDDLVRIFKENGLDKILIKHMNDDIIYAGSSAGAMLYTKVSMGDKDMFSDNFHNYNYKMVECLGLLNIGICPHYQNEDLIIYNDEVLKYQFDAFGIEEDCCLIIDNNNFYVVKEEKKNSVYLFDKDKNYQMIPLYEGIMYEKNSSFRA